MRCLLCEKPSFSVICKKCQSNFLFPTFHKRELEEGFYNYSFYSLSELEDLLSSKYYFFGDRVFNVLAKLSFERFALNFKFDEITYAVPIDDHSRHEFSHTAILARALNSKNIKAQYNVLRATNIVKYAGKDKEYREKNPRQFKLTNIHDKTTILCDDIITTGATIREAKKALEKKNNKVLFSLTLADAKL
ncbi:phosphoribosyltransferase [Arcobacter nitrofigilis DSM 7299]|uniref:Phosphoribosyltransferase n=1 Tax=Arcobacter nitrofigilis (strain ATCC 33309 / DSM 7299 / CCUG 15893 / LMG 7604 / NCTC 12251 / CI) TaxID=572480 RepID=D5V2F8_ARCNC|nr:phosphoribosyltransferase family protein [Arcobacter nitrofigilis]ADG92391.1 phosphoribosyltransferase [Arcobacter nitrofigilis DSM 7299]